MALSQEKSYTVDDIYALPDGTRAELIDGEMYMMAPPGRVHQKILSYLHAAIYSYLQNKNGDSEVYPAPFAVFLNADDKSYVEPDISVICDGDKLDDRGCNGAPDWVVEIVSPGSRRMDYFIKLFKYRTAGVKEYWIVDPDRKLVIAYEFDGDDANTYSFSDEVPVGIYGGDLKIKMENTM